MTPAPPISPEDMQQAQALHMLLSNPHLEDMYVPKIPELAIMFNLYSSSAQENFTMQMAEVLDSLPAAGIQTLPTQIAGQPEIPSSALTHNRSVRSRRYTHRND